MNVRLLFLILLAGRVLAQTPVAGTVTSTRGEPLVGVNVYVKNTYDGASTDAEGKFSFKTTASGEAILVASLIGYEAAEARFKVGTAPLQMHFKLTEKASALNTVVITAGSFEASDEHKTTVLKPLDIVTTAGAGADIFAAMQALPGVVRVGEEEGLFVRGGAASETKTVIDGMVVENPFFSATPDVPQRGRFSPFLFKGMAFSTGGYSAQYGQALSSVLLLTSQDLPAQSQSSIGLTAVGPTLSHTQRWKNTSVAAEVDYVNLSPLFAVVRQNVDWGRPPEKTGTALTVRHQPTATSLVKFYGTYNHSRSAMRFRDWLDAGQYNDFALANRNAYANATYRNAFAAGKWVAEAGLSYSYNDDHIRLNGDRLGRHEQRTQARGTLRRVFSNQVSLVTGGEVHRYDFRSGRSPWETRRQDVYAAFFAESEVYLTRKLAGRAGVRGEYSRLLAAFNLAPRLSMAYQTGEFSQVSLAFGQFYQQPENRYLLVNPDLGFEKATHYILNYQLMRNGRTFRVEGYYKAYARLVKEYAALPFNPDRNRYPTGPTDNAGYGYARGVDVFWRDQKTFKNIDYWVSYSLLDTRRDYQNFLAEATPTFASRHNVSLVYKQFVAKLRSSLSATYNLASGRPYYNPHAERFLGDQTRPYHALGVNLSYLTQIRGHFTVVVASATNVLGTRNVFGYRYSPDGTQRTPIGHAADRGFFVGTFVSLGVKPYWQSPPKP
ncbi:MAG: TonB-dependent receptor [Cytophagales bacterium]|nr:TonB-dependent receptor [Cytophagales bacterium]